MRLLVGLAFVLLCLSGSLAVRKVGFVYNADLNHLWTYEHELGRVAVASTFKDQILTTAKYSVPEFDVAASTAAIEDLINTGHELIFTTSSGYLATTPSLAPSHPNILFIQVPGWDFGLDNVIGVDGRLYEAYYLAGKIAGRMTTTNKLGVVNGVPSVPVVVNSLNAFAIGARSVNPAAEIKAIYLNTWTDPRLHQQASHQLLDWGADHVFAITGSTVPDYIAADLSSSTGQEIHSIGFASDFRVTIGPTVTTSAVFRWETPYLEIVDAWLNGTATGGSIYRGIAADMVDAAPPSDLVPQSVRDEFWIERANLIAAGGEETIFCGSYLDGAVDNDGNPVVPAGPNGTCLDIVQVSTMTWHLAFVELEDGNFFFKEIYLEADSGASIALMVINSISMLLAVIFFLVVLVYMKTPVIRYAAPLFCVGMIAGGVMQLISTYIFLQKPTDGVCMAAPWLDNMGFVLMMSCFCVKNFRLWRIFQQTKKFKIAEIPPWHLAGAMVVALSGMIILMSIWQAVDPYEATLKCDVPELAPDECYLQCTADDEGIWIGITQGYIAFWLVAGAILAYLTRDFKTLFNEANVIALALYNIFVLQLICLPLIYTFEDDEYEARTILLALQPLYRATTTLCLIFGPKCWIAIFRAEDNVRPDSMTRGSSRSTRGASEYAGTSTTP